MITDSLSRDVGSCKARVRLCIVSIMQTNAFIAANVVTASAKGINDSPLNFLFSYSFQLSFALINSSGANCNIRSVMTPSTVYAAVVAI